jgi:hypothetical protein
VREGKEICRRRRRIDSNNMRTGSCFCFAHSSRTHRQDFDPRGWKGAANDGHEGKEKKDKISPHQLLRDAQFRGTVGNTMIMLLISRFGRFSSRCSKNLRVQNEYARGMVCRERIAAQDCRTCAKLLSC